MLMRCVWVFLDFFRCEKFTTIFKHLNMTSLNKIFNSAWFSFLYSSRLCFYSSGLVVNSGSEGVAGNSRGWRWVLHVVEQQLHKQEEMNFIHELFPLSSHSQTAQIHVCLIHRQSCTPGSDLIYSCLCGSLDHFKSSTVLQLCKFPD